MKIILSIVILLMTSLFVSAQNQMEINEQAAKEYKQSDKKLGKVYTELVKLIKTKFEKDLLIKAERAWITFRDAHSKFAESAYEGGSMQPTVFFNVMKELTDTRTKQLEDRLNEVKNR